MPILNANHARKRVQRHMFGKAVRGSEPGYLCARGMGWHLPGVSSETVAHVTGSWPSSTRGRTRPSKSCKPFEAWLRQATACGVRAVETFAAGLEQEGDAVRAALTMPWSNAQTDKDSYMLIRAYASLDERQRSQDEFYGSAEWRQGPRVPILALIDSYSSVVLELDEATVNGLRRSVAR